MTELESGQRTVACFGVEHGFGVDAGMEIWGREIGTRPAIEEFSPRRQCGHRDRKKMGTPAVFVAGVG